jgi:hypothetical protein
MNWNGLRCGLMRVTGAKRLDNGDIHAIFAVLK